VLEVLLAESSDGQAAAAGFGGVLALFLIAVAIAFYFLPTIVGWARSVRNIGSVAVINLFFGWTFVGWVVALAMSLRTVDSEQY
jgi:hypothetical protein